MTLAASGNITLAAISTETGVSLPLELTNATVRRLAGKRTGSVVMPTDFYSKNMALVPNWIDFPSLSASGTDEISDTETLTVTGNTSAITLSFETTNGEVNTSSGYSADFEFQIFRNGSYVDGCTWQRLSAGQTTGISRTISIPSVSASDTLTITAVLYVSGLEAGGAAGASATFTIKNTSSASNVVGNTFTIGLSGGSSGAGDPGDPGGP
jgi:hypothetical protein